MWRWRIEAYGLVLIAVYALLFMALYEGGWWLRKSTGAPILSDFTPMWLAGREALRGHAATAYDLNAFVAAQHAFIGPAKHYYFWPYPPIFFIPAALVALIPYTWAFFVWETATLLALLWVIYSVLPERAAIVAALSSPLVMFNAAVGQNGALSATLIGGALLLLERRPLAAGFLIGCLFYKLQFVFVLPLALAVSGRWRALLASAATTALLAAISLLVFGPQVWQAFPAALLERGHMAFIAHIPTGKIQSLYVLIRYLGFGGASAWAFQVVVSSAAVGLALLLWRSRASHFLKAAALVAVALIATPYLFAYDMVLLVVAAAFLAADMIAHGASRGVWFLLGALYLVQFAYVPLSDYPLGFFFNLAMFALILWRAWGNQHSVQLKEA